LTPLLALEAIYLRKVRSAFGLGAIDGSLGAHRGRPTL